MGHLLPTLPAALPAHFYELILLLTWPNIIADPTGTYNGDSDLQLERINVYFNEASGGAQPRVRAYI